MAHILLVEDDSSMRHFLYKALERAGHEVIFCANGLEALRLLIMRKNSEDPPFTLLLTDIVMPGLDGIQLSQKASEIDPHLKIMFMTGFSAIVMNRKEITDNVVVSKPFHLKDLVAQINQLLAA